MTGATDPSSPRRSARGTAEGRSITGLRVVIFTDRYDETVSFFRDGLGLPVHDAHGAGRGGATIFGAGPGTIEVVSEARTIGSGLMLRLEVDDVGFYGDSLAACGLRTLGPIELPWGERICGVGAPGGLLVNLVAKVAPPAPGPAGARRSLPPPDLAVVACAEGAPDPLAVLGLAPGDAHVVTNAGGVVNEETVRDLVAARRAFGVSRVVVVQHRPCAFMEPGPLPSLWSPDPVDRLRASLLRLVRPPLSLASGSVEGVLWEEGGPLTRVRPP